jgi:hypothetical protein
VAHQVFGAEEALELLDELILKGRLDQEEREAMRLTAMLQITADATNRPMLQPEDREILALLLSRWGFALTDRELAISALDEAFPVVHSSLARVLGKDPNAVEGSLRRLEAASVIQLGTPDDANEPDAYDIDFVPVLNELGASLAKLLYREFLDREAYALGNAADFYVESIGADIEELGSDKPADPRVRLLRNEYMSFATRSSVREVLSQWLSKPKAVYEWLDQLATFEERHAILSGRPETGLRRELAERATKRILILARSLEPPLTPAEAA